MLLEFIPQYCDETEAASARFPGDVPVATPASAGRTLGWVAAALALTIVLLLISSRGRASSGLWVVLAQADKINHPVFIVGIVLAAVGAAMVVVPLTYLAAQRRSVRPVIEQVVRVDLGDVVTLGMPSKELNLEWQGIVAVAETRNLFVLKTLGDLRLVLPKRGAPGFADSPAAAVDALRETLRGRVTPLAEAVPASIAPVAVAPATPAPAAPAAAAPAPVSPRRIAA